jgi:hypothetical protein
VTELPIYTITIDPEYAEGGEDLGIEAIAFTSKPAIKVKGMAFNQQTKALAFKDGLKYRITAPAMIPMEIYRRDDETDEEYMVKFTVEEIDAMHSKFMQQLVNSAKFNLEHNEEKKVPAYILEAWLVDKPELDKAYTTYGIEVPAGTLMLTAQITDIEYYNKLVEEDQVGFSIEGFMGMKLKSKYNMQLPDGEHLIKGKIYVVKDGIVVEIKEEEKVEETMEEKEEVAMAETVVEEEEVKEEVEAAVDPAMDAEAILAIVQPMIAEQINSVLAIVAELKSQLEEALGAETEVEEETIEIDAKTMLAENLRKFNQFNSK